MKIFWRNYEYMLPDNSRGNIRMPLAIEFDQAAQEVYLLSQTLRCADAMMRMARNSILDDRNGIITVAFTFEGGFDLAAGSHGAYEYWDYKWRPRIGYDSSTHGYGLDIDLTDKDGYVIYWQPKRMTPSQVRAIEGTVREFLGRLRAYESMLSSGLKLMRSSSRFDRCEDILEALFAEYSENPFLFALENAGSPYKPRSY
jgi:hypothetical protein